MTRRRIEPHLRRAGSGVLLLAGVLTACTGDDTGGGDAPPSVAIDTPVDGQIIGLDTTLTLVGVIVDEAPPSRLHARWSVGGTTLCEGAPAADGTSTCALTTSVPGDLEIELEATDPGGAVASAAATLVVTEKRLYDASCTITITNGEGTSGEGDAVTLAATFADTQGDGAGVAVAWTSDLQGLLDTTSTDDAGAVDLTTADLWLGMHRISARATGADGRSCVDGLTWTVDAAPSLVIVSPADGSTVPAGEPVVFAAVTSDEGDPAQDLWVSWVDDRDGLLHEGAPDGWGNAEVLLDDLSTGAHHLTVTSTDPGGRSTSVPLSLVVDGPPTAPSIHLTPALPTTDDALVVSITTPSIDPEGGPLTYTYAWSRFGIASTESSSDTLPASATTGGDVWTVDVRATDGLSSSAVGTATVTIANTAPTVRGVVLSPSEPGTEDIATAVPTAEDPDGDVLTYTYAWAVDGVTVQSGTSATLSGTAWFDRGQEVMVTVTASDGTSTASASSDPVTVENTPPEAPGVDIVPDDVTSGGELSCSVPSPSRDADGDPVTYTFAWTVDGVPYDGAADGERSSVVPGADVVEEQVWACMVTPDDGFERGAVGTATTERSCAYLHFDGASHVSVPASPDFPTGNDPRTVAIRISTGWHGHGNAFTFGSGRVNNSRWSLLVSERRPFKVVGESNDYYPSGGPYDHWTQVTIVYDGASLMLYEDGALVDTLPVATPFATSPDYELIIGSNSLDRADEFYVGALADLRVWNRALTPDEVASEFVSHDADPTDLVGQWRMSEGEGSVAEDASGNGHEGTIVGATWRTRECGR